MKVAAAVQNVIQCYRVTCDEGKKIYHPDITGSFFFKRVDRVESSKEPEPVASTSGVQLAHHLLLLMIL